MSLPRLRNLFLLSCFVLVTGVVSHGQEPISPHRELLEVLESFEGKYDPKCYATAARLEDFMYGTPLAEEARHLKNRLIKRFVLTVWRQASAGLGDGKPVDRPAIDKSLGTLLEWETAPGDGPTVVKFGGGEGASFSITARDLRQYGSVAYSLRAILAGQQENLLSPDGLPRLAPDAVDRLRLAADLVGLSLLQGADRLAVKSGEREISTDRIAASWRGLFGTAAERGADAGRPGGLEAPEGQPLLAGIIAQKRASYAAYNQISNQLFVRNLQVYFARLSWPKDPGRARVFRQAFTESVIAFAADLYRDAAEQAAKAGAAVIGEREVAISAQRFLPHEVNQYEDVIFFPRLGRERSITIESYDFDAFRDSGIHWHYLGNALEDLAAEKLPDADPFAAELLAEMVANFGVLALRMAGEEGIARDEERLSVELLELAMRRMQVSVSASHRAVDGGETEPAAGSISSADGGGTSSFVELGGESGIDYMHRSSDWLSRLLRSYLRSGEGTGTITIPPAFGGSGLAAEDVNGDGAIDLLFLGGLGNRLFLGKGDGSFTDATASSGLAYRRPEDRQPGEARQPLVADFDNDGHQDVFISYVDDPHRLYRGHGDGTFSDVTATAGLGGEGLVGGPATAFDYDNDGLLDIYICYFGNYVRGVLPTLKRRNENATANRLFRNLGGMRFVDVTGEAGVGDPGWGQSALHCDFDGDGNEDLISGNDFGVNRYYRNRGDGRFEEVSAALGTDKPSYTMSLSTADLNGDLRPDIYVSNIVTMNKDEKYVLPNEGTRMKFDLAKLAHLRVIGANDLFLSLRGGGYSLGEVVGRGYARTGWAWDADFFDADLDGDDDLYVLNGMNEFNLYSSRSPYFMDPEDPAASNAYVPISPREPNVYFENDEGKLNAPEQPSGLEFLGNSRSAAFLDWDGDGDLDVATNNFGEAARLFTNRAAGKDSRWIKLKLAGSPQHGINRDAIGARVIIHLPGGRKILREVRSSTGYQSVHPKEIHAGLGSADEVDIEIIWPGGDRQVVSGLRANRQHRIAFQPGPAE